MPTPPTWMILEMLRDIILPVAGGAALIYALFLMAGRWAAALGAAAAFVAAFLWANFQLAIDEEHPHVLWEQTSRLIAWKPNERYAWHFLPRAALVLLLVGLGSRWTGLLVSCVLPERAWWVKNLLVWVPRWVAILVAGSWVVPAPWAEAHSWIKPALGAVMLFSWIALDGLARSEWSASAAFALSAMFVASGVVILYAGSDLYMKIALVNGLAFFAIGVVSYIAKADCSGAIPAGIAFLPSLIVNVRYQLAPNGVPFVCFWLLALSPLVLLLFAIPRIARQNRWLLLAARAVLVMIPLALAVGLATHYEKLPPFGDEEEAVSK